KNPWKDVAISGFVTMKGEKMSKSKGNVISPQEILEKYGADAMRYWAASSKLGEDFDYQEKDLVTGKKLVTKLINASRFIFMNLKDYKRQKPKKLEPLDELFLKELNYTIKEATKDFEEYQYSNAKTDVENFFWKDFADNYLEIVKNRIYNGKGNEKISAQYTLYNSFLTILKMFAPFIPFITEEIYQEYYKKNEKTKSIHLCEWPKNEKMEKNPSSKKYEKWEWGKEKLKWELLLKVISNIRQEKSIAKKSMKTPIVLTLEKKDKSALNEVLEDLKAVSTATLIQEGKFNVKFTEQDSK
ncbi:MAG: class I tRNA ligase family protein, partial [Nanoarchaeota archaeon]